ncbi:MAG: hypothetical protein JNM26_02485 [Ideonella sp.]|nr:hypothetical protein [Ideonella sp.]
MNTDLPKPPVLTTDMTTERQLEMIGRWMTDIHAKMQQIVDEFAVTFQTRGQAVELPQVSLALLAKFKVTQGVRLVAVTDEVDGTVPAFSDGTNWRRVTDRNVVS